HGPGRPFADHRRRRSRRAREGVDLHPRSVPLREEGGAMALTPVEIRHLQPSKGFRGYKRGPTDRLFVEIAESFEEVGRERADLADKVESLEADLVRFRELEALLRTTLVSAE